MCQILLVWFGRPISDTFLVISRDSVHIFQNRFLRWNREFKPVDLNTMNPIIWTFFFSPLKGSEPNFGGNSGGLRKLRFGWNIFCELMISFLMGKWFVFICFWHFNFFEQPYAQLFYIQGESKKRIPSLLVNLLPFIKFL